nr:MAG TPA: hypothetical protein [Caudoviricetes sp.]
MRASPPGSSTSPPASSGLSSPPSASHHCAPSAGHASTATTPASTAADTQDPLTPTRRQGIHLPPRNHHATQHRQGPCTQADQAPHPRARTPLGPRHQTRRYLGSR